jgi:hypothetical protein
MFAMTETFISKGVDIVSGVMSSALLSVLIGTWLLAMVFRALVTYTVSREHWFAYEFQKRAREYLESLNPSAPMSFFAGTKRVLEKTYYELFEVRAVMQRRKPDMVRSLSDRLFLIQHGCARLVRETIQQVKFLKWGNQVKFVEVAKSVFEHNPCFRRVVGVVPVAAANDFLSILPGLFIIGGIFGTFLGIMKALPELGGMDLQDTEGTKVLMDQFLVRVSASMACSAVGICCSVTMTLVNTAFSAERRYVDAIQRYENSLELLWMRSTSNEVPAGEKPFDENRDPIEALAENALSKELEKKVAFVPKAS